MACLDSLAGRPVVCLREDRLSACGKTGCLPAGRPAVCLRGDWLSACGETGGSDGGSREPLFLSRLFQR